MDESGFQDPASSSNPLKMAEGANPAGFSSAEQLFPVAQEGATYNL